MYALFPKHQKKKAEIFQFPPLIYFNDNSLFLLPLSPIGFSKILLYLFTQQPRCGTSVCLVDTFRLGALFRASSRFRGAGGRDYGFISLNIATSASKRLTISSNSG